MTRVTDFATYLKKFLQIYLPGVQGLSQNTIYSYRDAMTLFLRYCEDKENIKIDRFSLAHFNKERILRFLEYLETELKYSVSSRNQRLAAIHAFFQFLLREDICYLSISQEVLNIPMKRKPKSVPSFLSLDSVKLLLEQPDLSKPEEYRDLAIMTLMYDTGARVQEIIDLTVGDIRTVSPPTVTLHGKGDKTRCVPIMKETQAVILDYLEKCKLMSGEDQHKPVFTNKYREPFTRAGISYILNKYATKANSVSSDSFPEHIHPHMLRHSRAMHLLQAGVNLVYIRDILGHASVTTTEVYARADDETKRRAIEAASPSFNSVAKEWEDNPKLLDWLKSL